MRKSILQKNSNLKEVMMSLLLMKNLNGKKGQINTGLSVVLGLILGIGSLIVSVILIFVFVQTVVDANLLTANSLEDNATDNLRANFTTGVDNVSKKIPTVLLIAGVVLLFAALAILALVARNAGFFQGASQRL